MTGFVPRLHLCTKWIYCLLVMQMQAAQTILDRVGIAKTDRIDLKVEAPTGLFILPAKTVVEGEYEVAEN